MLDQPPDPVQRDDGLAGARAPADPRRSAVGPFNDPPLHGVQVHLPAFEALLKDGLQRLVVGGDERGGAVGRRRVVGRVDRFRGRDRGGDLLHHLLDGGAVMQGEQDVGGELGDALGELEQLLLGRDLPDRRQQRPAHAQPGQLRFRVASEKRRGPRRRGRLDGPVERGHVIEVDAAGDLVDLVGVPVHVVVGLASVLDRDEHVLVVLQVQHDRPVVVADPRRVQPRVALELLEPQAGAGRVLAELPHEVPHGALDRPGQLVDVLVGPLGEPQPGH